MPNNRYNMKKFNHKYAVELFSGSGIVSKILTERGYKTITVDINPKLKPSICCDILNLKASQLPKNVSFFWISPDCETYSRAGDSKNWKKEIIKYRVYKYVPLTEKSKKAIRLLNKVESILSVYPGVKFLIENPIGRIQHMDVIKRLGHYRYAVNYSNWGFKYSKETYLFTNFLLPLSTKKVHSSSPGLRTINSKYQRSMVPAALIRFILNYL